MTNVAEWASGNNAKGSGIHDLHVPVIPERTNDPPTNRIGGQENGKANAAEDGIKGAMEEYDFERGTDYNQGMHQNHPAESWFSNLRCALCHHLLLMLAGNVQFVEAQKRHDGEKPEIELYA